MAGMKAIHCTPRSFLPRPGSGRGRSGSCNLPEGDGAGRGYSEQLLLGGPKKKDPTQKTAEPPPAPLYLSWTQLSHWAPPAAPLYPACWIRPGSTMSSPFSEAAQADSLLLPSCELLLLSSPLLPALVLPFLRPLSPPSPSPASGTGRYPGPLEGFPSPPPRGSKHGSFRSSCRRPLP